MKIDPRPAPPPDLAEAAKDGSLVVFVGAGVSRLVGCPSWDGFADGALKQLAPKCISHYGLEQIRSIGDAKKRLSIAKIVAERSAQKIDFARILKANLDQDPVYAHLAELRCAFVTTNYDTLLTPIVNAAKHPSEWRFSRREQLLGAHLDRLGNVLHLHGSVEEVNQMVLSTHDYLIHYASREVQDFLVYLFERKVVLFLGYGLEEVEILEYILRKGEASARGHSRRYILQPFFNAEYGLCDLLSSYYRDTFGVEVIPYSRDQADFNQLTLILEDWSSLLKFGSLALAEEIAAIEDEING